MDEALDHAEGLGMFARISIQRGRGWVVEGATITENGQSPIFIMGVDRKAVAALTPNSPNPFKAAIVQIHQRIVGPSH